MDQGERPEDWSRLWAAVRPHAVEDGELGEYAAILLERGPEEAGRGFPTVATHLQSGCQECSADLQELAHVLAQPEPAATTSIQPAPPQPITIRPQPIPLARPNRRVLIAVAAASELAIVAAAAIVFTVGMPLVPALLVLVLGGVAFGMIVMVATGRLVEAGVPAGSRAPLTSTRRAFLVGIVGVWFVGTAGLFALPGAPRSAVLVVTEPGLRAWVEDVIQRDESLRAINWRIVGTGDSSTGGGEWLRLGLARGPEAGGRRSEPVARSPYVVVVWEQNRARLGLDRPGPVEWASVQQVVADPSGPRFVLPLPGSPLGDDGLLLLALASQAPGATDFPGNPAGDPALDAWLRPFYQRQTRLRSDERIQADDWARYRATLGEAGLLPEHTALALIPIVEPQSRLHLRYPGVNVTRTYALGAPAGRDGDPAYERLRAGLLAPEAQRTLAAFGFRPVLDVPVPTDGPFVVYRSRGADWGARWTEASRSAAFEAWAGQWRP